MTDSGIGIPPEPLPRVFDLFAGPAGRARRPGSASAWRWRAGWWNCTAEPSRPTATGPAAAAPSGSVCRSRPTRPRRPPAHPGAPAPATPRRVLLIDDNVDALRAMAIHVAALGGEARTAPDGQSGVEQAANMRPHVVLLDIGMPGIDGYETCRRIRGELGADAMLVAVTGWGQRPDKARAPARRLRRAPDQAGRPGRAR